MLVVNRKIGDEIILTIDGNKKVTIKFLRFTDKGSNTLRVGIDAPKDVDIYRNEAWDRLNKGGLKQK